MFGGLRVDGDRLRVGLTVLDPYGEQLRAQMGHPERLDLVHVTYTERDMTALQDEVIGRARASGVFLGCGRQFQCLRVRLRADGVDLAKELYAEFGDRVRIVVGRRPFPPVDDSVEPPPAPNATTSIPGLRLRAVLDAEEVRSGAHYDGQVVLRNEGIQTITLSTDQPLVASLVDHEGHVAGAFTGVIAGTALGMRLGPGDQHRIRFHGGTAGYGTYYATPPGDYQVLVVVPIRGPNLPGQLVTPPVALRVT